MRGAIEGAAARLEALLEVAPDHTQRLVHLRRELRVAEAAAYRPLDLQAQDLEFAGERAGGPAEPRALEAVAVGDEPLDVGGVGQQRGWRATRLVEGDERRRDVREHRPRVVDELGVAKRRR